MKQHRLLHAASRAFTIMEIMTALVIFSGSMLAYLGYQASVAKVLYDAQSTTLAGHIADDLVQAIDLMDSVEFQDLVDNTPMDAIQSDNDVALFIKNLRNLADTPVTTGPFTAQGAPLAVAGATGPSYFHRHIRINTYGAETNTSGLTVEQLWFYYYHVEVIVSWPKAGAALTTNCSDLSTAGCDRLNIHFMKGTR